MGKGFVERETRMEGKKIRDGLVLYLHVYIYTSTMYLHTSMYIRIENVRSRIKCTYLFTYLFTFLFTFLFTYILTQEKENEWDDHEQMAIRNFHN